MTPIGADSDNPICSQGGQAIPQERRAAKCTPPRRAFPLACSPTERFGWRSSCRAYSMATFWALFEEEFELRLPRHCAGPISIFLKNETRLVNFRNPITTPWEWCNRMKEESRLSTSSTMIR